MSKSAFLTQTPRPVSREIATAIHGSFFIGKFNDNDASAPIEEIGI